MNELHIGRLFSAELQFRLASAVQLAVTMGEQPIDLPIQWSHGKHVVEYKEIALRPDQADFAAQGLQRSATFQMAVVMRDAIAAIVPNAKDHPTFDIRSAFQISRLIRNAFSHGPISPIWSIESIYEGQTFSVSNIITLDTTGLNGKPFDWTHYGGPLALLRLYQFVRFEILGDTGKKPSERVVEDPKIKYYQQGPLILRKVDD
jgi:hypothetical protein